MAPLEDEAEPDGFGQLDQPRRAVDCDILHESWRTSSADGRAAMSRARMPVRRRQVIVVRVLKGIRG